ncbi:MAG: PepSY domain-containing protein [Methylobacter sp.]
MKSLIWLLYQAHRWVGVVLGLFMFFWFFTGLVIMYSTPTTQNRSQQLAHAETLAPEVGWLSLGDAWDRSAEQRKAAAERKSKAVEAAGGRLGRGEGQGGIGKDGDIAVSIADARLVRSAGEPVWLVEDSRGLRFALSAIDGSLRETTPDQALKIAENWFNSNSNSGAIKASYLETVEKPIILRNQDALSPFHRIAVGEDGGELLISSRTGEVLHASTRVDRAFFWAGNWLHLLKPLESIGLGKIRNDVQLWLGLSATIATLTGLIIGWLRWRPGFGGKPTYSQGRTQPYREFWFKWHFWSGLIGGTVVLSWAISGFVDTNPGKIFSQANSSRQEVTRYLGGELPEVMRNWQPVLPVLLATAVDGRVAGNTIVESREVLTEYDNYYYPRHHQNLVEKPLPVLLVKMADNTGTRFYLDPQDGKLLAKLDRSGRVLRWLYSGLHHWDFGWLYQRPIWDVWMMTWVLFGLVLGTSSLVVGWRLLKKTFAPKKRIGSRQRTGRRYVAEIHQQ